MTNLLTKEVRGRAAPLRRLLSCALSCAVFATAGATAMVALPNSAHAEIDPSSNGVHIDYGPHWTWGYNRLISQNYQFKAAVLDDGVYYYEYFSTLYEAIEYTADMLETAQLLGDYDLQADVIGYGTLDDNKWYFWPEGFFGSGQGGDQPWDPFSGGGGNYGGGGASGGWGGTGASSSRGPELDDGSPPPSGSGYECTFYDVVNGNNAAPNSCQAIWNCSNGQTVILTQPCNHQGPGPVPPGSAPLA